MKLSLFAAIAAASVALASAASSSTVSLTVDGNSNPYLSGMPNGSTASSGDVAPNESPVEVTGLPLMAGHTLSFGVTGSTSNTPGPSGLGPDGGPIFTHFAGAQNGMSDITAPISSLLGVFLTDTQPSLNPSPTALSFGTTTERDFSTLSPELQQVFFIGDGLDESASSQSFVIPTGATRLYLGTMDGFGWFNNSGAFEVTITKSSQNLPPVVPLPAGAVLLISGVGVLVLRRRAS